MAIKGYHLNPSQRDCFNACEACFRCGDRYKYAKCNGCSGKHDPFGTIDPHPDDWCNCTEGILRFVKPNSQRVMVRYKTNPFDGKITMMNKTEDEKAWDDYVRDLREKLDDPTWEPIKFTDAETHAQMQQASNFNYLGNEI